MYCPQSYHEVDVSCLTQPLETPLLALAYDALRQLAGPFSGFHGQRKPLIRLLQAHPIEFSPAEMLKE